MRRLALLGTLAAWLVAATPASGHSVMKVEGGTIFYNATDDVALNKLSVTQQGNQIRFYDPGAAQGISAGDCTPGDEFDSQGNPIEIFCSSAGISAVRADIGEGQDEATVDLAITALVIGGNGADRLVTGRGNDIVNGGEGNDDIRTDVGNDQVVGGGGDDTIVSGEGNDVVQGGLGSDAIDTAGGDDEVRVRDGAADQVACGVGADRAQIDGGDRVADCESVEGVAAAEGAPEPGSSPATPEAQPPAPDTVAPRLRAGGLTRQRLGRRGFVRVAATVTEAAELYATGYAEISGVRHALGRTRADVTFGGGGAELRIKLDPPALRAARRALRRKRRALVVISVLATDRAGNSTPVTLPRILLQR